MKQEIKLTLASDDVPRNTDAVYIWYKKPVEGKTYFTSESGEGFFEDGQWYLYHEKDNGSWTWEAIYNENVFAWIPTVFEGELRQAFEVFENGQAE